jgi:hypothetical protein
MARRSTLALFAFALVLAGCGQDANAPANAANEAAAANQSAPSAAAPSNLSADRDGAPAYLLAGNGLEPGLTFGMPQQQVVAAATAAFGPRTGSERNEECGEGAIDFVNFGALQLHFQEGRFAGWSISERHPTLRTRGGLAIGAPRSALGSAPIDRDSTLGAEFNIGDVGGLLDESGREIAALWAGLPCNFR